MSCNEKVVCEEHEDDEITTISISSQQGGENNAITAASSTMSSSIEQEGPISVKPINLSQIQHLQQLLNCQEFISETKIDMTCQYIRSHAQGPYLTSREMTGLSNMSTNIVQPNMLWFDQYTRDASGSWVVDRDEMERTSSARTSMSLKKYALGPPPLCSICNNVSPKFGQPPHKFSYAELNEATCNFSPYNYLAEGGFGFVYKGTLRDGQEVAVKQHKLASSQGDMEFYSEVEVLSCAQHRNLVKLIGYCLENRKRLLVYEYVCNGSLDRHLSSSSPNVLEWEHREKIAIGAARGLRYLHEEVRVGCIVHRDLRPNNILLTHDFIPMVGDFGLARWQPDGNLAVETRVIGTLGYLAPEYAETGQITDKADVYSFGVVLLELITGRKAIDPFRPKGQQCLTEWFDREFGILYQARPLLEEQATNELLDPRLQASYDDYELYCMVHAASQCIRKEPSMRPRMRQVLRILEGSKEIGNSSLPTSVKTMDDLYFDINLTPTFISDPHFAMGNMVPPILSHKVQCHNNNSSHVSRSPQNIEHMQRKNTSEKGRSRRGKARHNRVARNANPKLSYHDMLS